MTSRITPLLLFVALLSLTACKKESPAPDEAATVEAPVDEAASTADGAEDTEADERQGDAAQGEDTEAPALAQDDAPAPADSQLRLQLGGSSPGGFTGSQPRLIDTNF